MLSKSKITVPGLVTEAARLMTIRLETVFGCIEKPVSPLWLEREAPETFNPLGALQGSSKSGVLQYSKAMDPTEVDVVISNWNLWSVTELVAVFPNFTDLFNRLAARTGRKDKDIMVRARIKLVNKSLTRL
jgi:hypothetical protein